MGLWASGLLDPNMGGEGVKPYQPAGLWSALMHPASNTKNYEQDQATSCIAAVCTSTGSVPVRIP